MQFPKLPFIGGRGTPDLEAQAAVGQTAVETYEWSEHAKWGKFLQETEATLMAARNDELARPRPGRRRETATLAEETGQEVEA